MSNDERSVVEIVEDRMMRRTDFPIKPQAVEVTFDLVSIEPHPRPVRSVFGRGDWPHQNIIFVREHDIYQLIERKLSEAYMSLGAQLEMTMHRKETE